MINSLADLLLELKNTEQELLKKYEIVKHPGIIGDMYEGLTKELLSKSMFKGIDLRVKAGKIRNSKGEYSGEIDCMIVIGDGEQIPYTDKFIYDSKQVIAVIQVKKNLYSKDLKEAYENLRTVNDVTEPRDGEAFHGRLLRNAWRLICKEELPAREDLGKIELQKQMLYHVLLMEAFLPARIVWGYHGFKSEFALRESFLDYLSANATEDPIAPKKTTAGFGPLSFPNLVICDKYSLIKANGIPFAYPIGADNWWSFFVSTYQNPVYILLEIIWTRLHFQFGITSEIFGDDLTSEEMHGYLLGRYKQVGQLKGWEYFAVPITKDQLEMPLSHRPWEPVFVDQILFMFLNRLCSSCSIDVNKEPGLIDFLSSHGYSIESFLKAMKETGLVDAKEGILTLITEKCVCGVTRDGRLFAGDDKTGRVTRWMINMDK